MLDIFLAAKDIKMYGQAYQVMQQEQAAGEHYYHREVEYLLLSVLSKQTNANYPIMEVGPFDGKCSIFYYESALSANRQFDMLDIFNFIPEQRRQEFIDEVLLARLSKINPELDNLNLMTVDGTTFDFSTVNPSFLVYDIAAQEMPSNLLDYISKMPEKSILTLANMNIGFRPNFLNSVFDIMNKGKLHLIAASNHYSFFTPDLSFKNQLETSLINDPVWLHCKEIGLSGTINVGTQKFHRFRTSFGQQNAVDTYKQKYSIG